MPTSNKVCERRPKDIGEKIQIVGVPWFFVNIVKSKKPKCNADNNVAKR